VPLVLAHIHIASCLLVCSASWRASASITLSKCGLFVMTRTDWRSLTRNNASRSSANDMLYASSDMCGAVVPVHAIHEKTPCSSWERQSERPPTPWHLHTHFIHTPTPANRRAGVCVTDGPLTKKRRRNRVGVRRFPAPPTRVPKGSRAPGLIFSFPRKPRTQTHMHPPMHARNPPACSTCSDN
jgi:hypothetical protein